MTERLVGRMDGIGLTHRGMEQARKLAASLLDWEIDRIVSSPRQRASETAAQIVRDRLLQVELHQGFDELDFGRWTGTQFSHLKEIEEWKLFNNDRVLFTPPGGESLLHVQERALSAVTSLWRETPGQTILVVTHADVIRTLLCLFCGAPLELLLRFSVAPASVSIIELADWGASVHCINQTLPAHGTIMFEPQL